MNEQERLPDEGKPDENMAPSSTPPEKNTDRESGDIHAQTVSNMFGRLTPWYDLQNHVFSLGMDFWWRRNLVRAVVPGPTRKILDLAAGTLDVSIALCKRYKGIEVTAADICKPMLDFGMEHKVRKTGENRIFPLVADARALPLPDASFDAVTMAFGIRNVLPRLDALKEMHRVLVPGGRACILEFAPVDIPIFGALYHWYLRTIMPRLAGLICSYPEAYTYLADTVQNFPRPVEFCEELRNAGFPFVTYTSLTLGVANLHIAVKVA